MSSHCLHFHTHDELKNLTKRIGHITNRYEYWVQTKRERIPLRCDNLLLTSALAGSDVLLLLFLYLSFDPLFKKKLYRFVGTPPINSCVCACKCMRWNWAKTTQHDVNIWSYVHWLTCCLEMLLLVILFAPARVRFHSIRIEFPLSYACFSFRCRFPFRATWQLIMPWNEQSLVVMFWYFGTRTK